MKMDTPYIGFSNDTLQKLPKVNKGDKVFCIKCGGEHPLECGTDSKGHESSIIMFYKCGDTAYLGAVDGCCTVLKKADVSGRI
jgi:hypothetical protein